MFGTLALSRVSRRAALTVGAGLVASAALTLSMNSTLAAFTAQITNSVNTTATGNLVMQEVNSGGTVTCNSTDAGTTANTINTNASICSGINKYGGSTTLVPGATSTTVVTIKNTGTVPATTFTLAPGACTQSNNGTVNGSATDLCTQLSLTVSQTVGATAPTTVATGTLTGVAGKSYALTTPVAPGQLVTYSFAVTLPAATGNTYQGLAASQPLVWQFTS